jgi:hypothetical protein
MKKLAALTLIALTLGAFAFADDAKTMPKMVGRVYVAPTFSFIPAAYDNDGKYQSFDDGSIKAFNLGFALEFGVIDWVTAAVQWAPGWTIWSDVAPAMKDELDMVEGMNGGKRPEVNTNGVADLFVGAKVQIVGEKAPLTSEMFRVAIAPGVIIPLPGPDFDEQAKNLLNGDKATVQPMDNHVWAAGARLYFDWIINERFFLNLYNESIFYLTKRDLAKAEVQFDMGKNAMKRMAPPLASEIDKLSGEVNYKYRLTFELEPVYTQPLTEGITLNAGLPVNFEYKPAAEYTKSGFDNPALAVLLSDPRAASFFSFEGSESYLLKLKPNVSVFITSTPLPLEFKLTYEIPIIGKNTSAAHNITLQGRVYFALPGHE